MKRQVATMTHNGTWKVIYDDSVKLNPYRIVLVQSGYNKLGVWAKMQKTVARFADLASCMYYLYVSTM